MVKYLASLLFLLKSSWAGRQQIEDVLSAMGANIAASGGTDPLRGLAVPAFGTFLDGYGCWGFFGGVGKGKALPVDDIDKISKSLQQNYECLIIATEANEPNACVDKPWDVTYQVTGSMYSHLFNRDMDKVLQECESANSNDCTKNVCKTEMGISLRLMNEFQSGSYNTNYEHLSGFDYAAECTPRVGIPGDRYCCGIDYPDKFVYKNPNGQQRSCCVDHTYDMTMLDCCNDGTSRAIGTCP